MPRTPENRDATVVYPGTSPKLLLAYRIFGPGYNSLEALAEQRKTIIRPSSDLSQEGESELTRLGEDLVSSMDLDTDQINSAYKTYQKEIKRMNKADRNHKRKRGQLDGADADAEDESSSSTTTSSPDSDETPSSSPDQTSSSIEYDDNDDNDDEAEADQQPSPKRKKTLDEHLEKYLTPTLWLPHATALRLTQSHRAALEQMHTTTGTFIEIYTTRLPYTRPLGQAVHHMVTNLMRWRADAARIERLITLHDNTTPLSTWGVSPDACGPKVTQALCMFWELDGVVGGMRRSLAHCEHLRGRFLAAPATGELRRRCYHELVYNLRRFASMCVIEELREEFVGELEEERRQWSPESSPDCEEYKTDFEDFSSDSESEGEEGEEDQEARTASDTAAPVQE